MTLNGTITDDKGLDIIARGFYFGTNSLYSLNDKIASTDTTASFTLNRSGLDSNTVYYATAYAANNINTQGLGSTISFILGTTTTTTTIPPAFAPLVETELVLSTQVTDTSMTLRGKVTDIGTSNVTEYGFYFGTDLTDFSKNTKYPVATSQNLSSPFSFTLDTSSIPLTLTAGTTYLINAYAINSDGQTVGDNVKQITYNIWNLRKEDTTNAQVQVPYDNTKSRLDSVTISSTA